MSDNKLLVDGEFWEEAAGLAEDMVEAGADEEKALNAIADFLDTIIPMNVIIPGPIGEAAEILDGPFIRKGVEEIFAFLKSLFHVDPEKKAARKAKRAEKKNERKAKRAARKAAKEI